MKDKLKCPFCEAELKPLLECGTPVGWCCPNFCKTRCALDEPVWQALIDGKKTQDALKAARNLYQELALAYCEMVDDYRTTCGRLKTPEQEAQEYMQEYDEKITSITKQEE